MCACDAGNHVHDFALSVSCLAQTCFRQARANGAVSWRRRWMWRSEAFINLPVYKPARTPCLAVANNLKLSAAGDGAALGGAPNLHFLCFLISEQSRIFLPPSHSEHQRMYHKDQGCIITCKLCRNLKVKEMSLCSPIAVRYSPLKVASADNTTCSYVGDTFSSSHSILYLGMLLLHSSPFSNQLLAYFMDAVQIACSKQTQMWCGLWFHAHSTSRFGCQIQTGSEYESIVSGDAEYSRCICGRKIAFLACGAEKSGRAVTSVG